MIVDLLKYKQGIVRQGNSADCLAMRYYATAAHWAKGAFWM